jgi:signal transduction histidine kinase
VKLFPPKVSLVFAAVMAVSLGGAILSSHLLEVRRADAAGLASSWRALAAVEHVVSALRRADAASRDTSPREGEPARRRYSEAANEVGTALEELGTALAGWPDGLSALSAVSGHLQLALAALERTQRAAAHRVSTAGALEVETRAALDRAESGLLELEAQARRELAHQESRSARSAAVSNLVVVSTDAAVLLLVCVALFAVRGHLRERERRDAEHRRVLELQQQLLGIVGHDLRTPLNAIAGSAALLARAPDLPTSRLPAAQRILSSAGRMSRLVRDLLDFTRARVGGGLALSTERAHLGDLCRRISQEVLAAYPDRAIRFAEEGDLEGEWDPARLEQVFSNLVANACHYGGAAPVLVRVTGTRGTVVVQVHNEGPPIPSDVLPHIFEPFRRGPSDRASGDGLGLGLYIVRTLVEAHRGTIEVVTGSDGTTFQVSLPRGRGARASRHASMA